MIGHLHFFFVIDENEPVFIIGSKVYHFLCDDEKVQIGRLRSDAQLKMSTVSAQIPVSKEVAQTLSHFSLSN